MKFLTFCLVLALAPAALAAPTQPSAPLIADLTKLEAKFRDQAEQGLRSEEAYAEDLKAYDALIKKYQAEGPDICAQLLHLKALKYVGLLNNKTKAIELIRQLKRDYPGTELGRKADQQIIIISRADESDKIRRSLFVGAGFPDFVAKDLNGFPVGSAALRGKVLFLDFGATTQPLWCQQTTNLLAAYKKFHSQGFEVITVSLDESPAKIAEFARAQGLPWRVVCDGREWAGTLALKYGLAMLPSNLIIDRYGSIFTRTVAASEFDAAITKALAYKKPAVKIIPGTNLPAAKSAPAPAKK